MIANSSKSKEGPFVPEEKKPKKGELITKGFGSAGYENLKRQTLYETVSCIESVGKVPRPVSVGSPQPKKGQKPPPPE